MKGTGATGQIAAIRELNVRQEGYPLTQNFSSKVEREKVGCPVEAVVFIHKVRIVRNSLRVVLGEEKLEFTSPQ